jgi:peptidoglycan/xylan/chitin deacetylase (PgdA/CDA1 family)
LLTELSIPSTLFVPVGFIQGESPPPIASARRLPPMSWAQLREVARSSLVTIGSHSWTHPDLRAVAASGLARELRDSRSKLEDELDVAVDAFAYPRALWSPRVEARVREVYDRAALGGGRRITCRNLDPLRLWRIPIRSEMESSLAMVLRSRVWIEEWIADAVRRRLRRAAARPAAAGE